MPQWKTTVRLGDLHVPYQVSKMTIQDVGKELAKRLRANKYVEDIEMDCTGALEDLEQGVKNAEEYDDILKELYDFGDFNNRIWFDPSTPTKPEQPPESLPHLCRKEE